MIWRTLNDKEVEEFRQWARDNHKPGNPVNDLWHPVVREECKKIDEEGER